MINAKYPNGFKTKEKYVESLIGFYALEYQSLDLDKEQWRLPISKAINCVSGYINDFNTPQWALGAIDYIKDSIMPNLSDIDIHMITKSYDDRAELYYFSTGNEKEVIALLEEAFPESQKEQYLEFISKMTKDVINGICAETLKSIPEAEKVIYQRKANERSKTPSTEEGDTQQSFAQRVLDESSRKPSAEPKKRKVDFVEKVSAKSGRAAEK